MGRATRWLKGLFGTKKDMDKKGNSSVRQSTVGLCNKSTTIHSNCTPAEVTWLRSCHRGSQKEQKKHAMAVVAATAAVANGAVTAAQAAVATVRVTSGQSKGSRKITAAIKIQSVFRGHLARKALRALQGLVKLQALVRGYLVRKQFAATLHCMQALVRVQSNILARKTCRFYNAQLDGRKSMVDPLISNSSIEYKRSIHSRRLSTSFESPKIIEADRVRHRSRSRRTNTWMPDLVDDLFGPSMFSPIPGRTPAPLLMPHSRDIGGVTRFECQGFTKAQVSSSLKFANSYGCDGSVTPASSLCVESYFRNTVNHQSYMANTHSFEAKLRSKSAPKQRSEPCRKARTPRREIKEPRNSLDGVRLQRSEEVTRKS